MYLDISWFRSASREHTDVVGPFRVPLPVVASLLHAFEITMHGNNGENDLTGGKHEVAGSVFLPLPSSQLQPFHAEIHRPAP